MIAQAMLLAALVAPDSAQARAEGEAFAMLERLWHATRGGVYAVDRTRPPGREEQRANRDSVLVDEAWLLRLRDQLKRLPSGDCPRVPLVPGQSYPYLFVVEPQMPGEASTIELDFRGPCARFVRGGDVVASRSFRGREGAFVALLAGVLHPDRALARLADIHPATPITAPPAPALPRDSVADPDAGPRPGPEEFVPVDVAAAVENRTAAAYPEDARRRGIQGVVFVRALVGRSGHVIDASVQKSVPGLDVAAVEAVMAWRFKPAQRDGRPVMTWIVVPVRFTLH